MSTTVPILALTIFSKLAKEKFTVAPLAKSLVIEVGPPEILEMTMSWILHCCKEGKILPFTVYNVAHVLGIAFLEATLADRLDAMAADQVHFEDCRDIFTNASAERMFLRSKAAKSIAMAYYDGRIRDRSEYSMLRAEVGEFCLAVRTILTPLTDARSKAWALEEEKERQAEMKKDATEKLKMKWKDGKKEEIVSKANDWTVIKGEEEPEEDWVVVGC